MYDVFTSAHMHIQTNSKRKDIYKIPDFQLKNFHIEIIKYTKISLANIKIKNFKGTLVIYKTFVTLNSQMSHII